MNSCQPQWVCLLVDLGLLIARWWRDFNSCINFNWLVKAAWSTVLNGPLRLGLPIQPHVFNWAPTVCRQHVRYWGWDGRWDIPVPASENWEPRKEDSEPSDCNGDGETVGGQVWAQVKQPPGRGGLGQLPVGGSGWRFVRGGGETDRGCLQWARQEQECTVFSTWFNFFRGRLLTT